MTLPEATAAAWEEFWKRLDSEQHQAFQSILARNPRDLTIETYSFVRNTLDLSEEEFLVGTYRIAIEGLELYKSNNRAAVPETVRDVLRRLSPDDDGETYDRTKKVQNIRADVDGVPTRAYFIADKNLSFRHQGSEDKKPTKVFLRRLTDKQLYANKVLVYYSASGSGKTVELAGSAASRSADLAFVLSVEDPDESVVANEADRTEQLDITVDNEKVHSKVKDPDLYRESSGEVPEKVVDRQILRRRMENKSIAMSAMIEPLKNLVSGSKDALEEVVGAAKNQRLPLQVILAIDEGSKCTRILRGILRFPDIVKDMVCSTLSDGLDVDVTEADIDVQTSVAGTGVASATIGSVAPNFVIVTPYHELDAGKHKVYAKELRYMKQKLNVPWSSDFVRIDSFEVIKTQLPVVAMLMENGRMASIAISQLRAYEEDAPVNESHLVDNIVRRFMRSNGLNPLVGKENATKRPAVAAAALAVHLFSSLSDFALSVPERAKIDSFARKMKFFTFDSLVSGLVSVRQLVVDYGLLEPSDTLIKADQADTEITPPLQMKTAQQLIAVHMLGISLTEMLDPSWIGFEAMSTHFVKCAIAASVAVPMEKRPSLQRVLKTLGFKVDNYATHQDVCSLWEEMDSWCAVAASPLPSEKTPFHWETRQS